MSSFSYDIQFEYFIEKGGLAVQLLADLEKQIDDRHFLVKNIRTLRSGPVSVIPNLRIRRKNGVWVHCDSGKETDLSIAIGGAIDGHFGYADAGDSVRTALKFGKGDFWRQ